MRQLEEHIKKINWYRQGGALSLFYILVPYHSINHTIGYDRIIFYQEDFFNAAFFDKDLERKKAEWVIAKQRDNKEFINNWIKDWRKRVSILFNFINDFFSEPIEKWSNEKLMKFLNKLNDLWLDVWVKGVLIEWTDPEGHILLEGEIKKSGINFTVQEIEILTGPEKMTYVQEELLSRFEIIKAAKRGSNIEDLIRKHADNFYWYKNNWAHVEELTKEYFEKQIKKDIKNYAEIGKERAAINKYLEEIKNKKEKIIRGKNISEDLKNVFYLFAALTDWRDERKKLSMAIVEHYLYQIIKRLARENNIPEELALKLTFKDITGWKISAETLDEIKERRKGAVYYYKAKEKSCWLYGEKAQRIYKLLVDSLRKEELTGMIANKGKIIGKVKLVENKSDFKKFKKGNILVATMTRPEYMPLMKIAGAIITNEGGITCHAAIISRELNKPCIIGTQVATESLKDGDLVEVDADKGIIKILEKK
jgi:phosphoenolpyruvate synthase/pyruvate phosphate dikinase